MAASAADAAAFPTRAVPSKTGAHTTAKVLSLLTAGLQDSINFKPNTDAGMAFARSPATPSQTIAALMILRGLVGGYSATRLDAAIVTVGLAILLRNDREKVLKEHVRFREPKFQSAFPKPLILTIVRVVRLPHL